MKILQTVAHFSDEAVKEIMNSQTEIRAFTDWQIIYSVQTNRGKRSEEFASIREDGGFKNTTFNTLKEVELKLAEKLENLDEMTVKSITLFKWINEAL